ncbi:hypothetical protein BASA50_006153 [Batrachochytrium salamandrivorans]|uniref:SWIM-type domain-containing protein n=1 Tax=Batrachochytrium salamandrivorans TaxID=1357716 RepID=A0ABQ8FAQ3_9FUNG|nr:hypothetical protein BASA50_006153 [Batrachochytrium salamandrivorans]
MDDSDECTRLFRTSVGVPCRHEIKRRIEENRRFNIDDIHCQWHLHAPPAVLPVAVRVEPFSSPRKNLMQSIKRRLYEADDDQALLSWHVWMKQVRGHCSRFLTQSWQQSVVVQQDPQSARQSSEKSHSLKMFANVVRLVTILAHAMCKHLNNNKSV